jgi:alpha-N-arabinofuranosidase
MDIEISIEGFGEAKSVEHTLIKHADLEATNTEANPDNVKPETKGGASISGGKLSVSVPEHSYSMIRVRL